MNFWQQKIPMRRWEIGSSSKEYSELKIGKIYTQEIEDKVNYPRNNIGDIVFIHNNKSLSKKRPKGIYLVCKIVTSIESNEYYEREIKLEVILDLRKNPFNYEKLFPKLHSDLNTTAKTGHPPSWVKLDEYSPNELYKAIIDYKNDRTVINDIDDVNNDKNIKETEKEHLIRARLGQGQFRRELIEYWNGCSITDYDGIEILIASHIKPWKDSNNIERLDKFNGLLLLPTLDKLFDKGYITFTDEGEIEISNNLKNLTKLGLNKSMKIDVSPRHKKYLKFHRKEVFQG